MSTSKRIRWVLVVSYNHIMLQLSLFLILLTVLFLLVLIMIDFVSYYSSTSSLTWSRLFHILVLLTLRLWLSDPSHVHGILSLSGALLSSSSIWLLMLLMLIVVLLLINCYFNWVCDCKWDKRHNIYNTASRIKGLKRTKLHRNDYNFIVA